MIDDPALRSRLTRVLADCQDSYTETARVLSLDKFTVRRVLKQPNGPIPKTRVRLIAALDAYEKRKAEQKDISNAFETHPETVPELAHEVLRYVLQAVEAERGRALR